MERTPNSKKRSLSYKLKNSVKYENFTSEPFENTDVKTPIQSKHSLSHESDYSPVYIPHTQEAFDQLDVVWDWNSPQSKQKQKVPLCKQTNIIQSPRPIKKHVSNNQIESYGKLKNELEALQHQLVESRNVDKRVGKALFNNDQPRDFDDMFEDDLFEEKMILESQKIEESAVYTNTHQINNNTSTLTKLGLRKTKSESHIDWSVDDIKINQQEDFNFETHMIPVTSITATKEYINGLEFSFKDDSFTVALESVIDMNETVREPQSHKEILNKSMNNQFSEKLDGNKICNQEEIELKRLQALTKLKLRKQVVSTRTDNTDCNYTKNNVNKINQSKQQISKDETSPIKCSPEEIEQKRLQALAKLEAKKRQEKIERNRKEALKRLEMNKKKKVMASQNYCKK